MIMRTILHPSNRRIRLVVGVLVTGLLCVQCTRSQAFRESRFVVALSGEVFGKNAPEVSAEVIRLAKTDHIALLEYCLAAAQNRYHDYTCTLIKQERIGGRVSNEQEIAVKFLAHPFSVAMKWTPQTAGVGDRVLYVEGKYNDKMLVRPTGVFGQLVGTVMRQPDGPQAMQSTLRPVNQFGFRKSLESLLKVYRQALAAGDLTESFGGYAEVAGRKAVVLIRTLPPKDNYPAAKTVIYIDLEYLVPVAVEGYDWDQQLSSRYVFKDIRFNVGLTSEDFLPAANDMKIPN
jgi:hypothetical protein